MGIGKRVSNTDAMFKFSTKLFFRKDSIKNGSTDVPVLIEIYISTKGNYERIREPLHIKWPHDKIDCKNSLLLARHRDDIDVNDYNMIIMSERAKLNEIAKVYRLSNRMLTLAEIKRELIFADSNKSVVSYFELRKNELYRKKEISELLAIQCIKEFDEAVRFDQVNKKWMTKFKVYLKGQKKCT